MFWERALAITEKALGPEHPDTAVSLSRLAELYNAAGAHVKAEPLFERAQGIVEINAARFLPTRRESGRIFSSVAAMLMAMRHSRWRCPIHAPGRWGSRRCCSTRAGCSMRWLAASQC
jgi:hypothetical protein